MAERAPDRARKARGFGREPLGAKSKPLNTGATEVRILPCAPEIWSRFWKAPACGSKAESANSWRSPELRFWRLWLGRRWKRARFGCLSLFCWVDLLFASR